MFNSVLLYSLAAAKALARNGDGTTVTSCMGCDPTQGECYFNCQAKVDALYKYCDSGCLPDGYFYDPRKLIPYLILCVNQCALLYLILCATVYLVPSVIVSVMIKEGYEKHAIQC